MIKPKEVQRHNNKYYMITSKLILVLSLSGEISNNWLRRLVTSVTGKSAEVNITNAIPVWTRRVNPWMGLVSIPNTGSIEVLQIK